MVSQRAPFLVHEKLDLIVRAGGLKGIAQVIDLEDGQRALVWIDRRFARVRIRLDVLPALEAALGPGVPEALARTADQLRADAEFLESLSSERSRADSSLSASSLAEMPGAVRTRVLRSAALAAGCPAGALTAGHVARLEELVTDWHGQRWIDLPGGVRASRRSGQVCFETEEVVHGRC